MSNMQLQNFVDITVECKAAFRHTPCNICIEIYSGEQQKEDMLRATTQSASESAATPCMDPAR